MALAKVSGFFTNVGRIGHRPIPRCAKVSIDFFLACWIPAIFTQRNLDQRNSQQGNWAKMQYSHYLIWSIYYCKKYASLVDFENFSSCYHPSILKRLTNEPTRSNFRKADSKKIANLDDHYSEVSNQRRLVQEV